jgi:hypothetical protein
MVDMAKLRRETLRWMVLITLNNAQPLGAFESIVLSVLQSEYPDCTQDEMRRHLDYLQERDLIKIEKKPDGRWFAKLARYGVDVVEYTVDCEAGIARPAKYW